MLSLIEIIGIILTCLCALFVIFVTTICLGFYFEMNKKFIKPINNLINESEDKKHLEFEAELTNFATRFLCKLNSVSSKFEELLDFCISFKGEDIEKIKVDKQYIINETLTIKIVIDKRDW